MPSRNPDHARRPVGGLGLIDLLVAMAIGAVLAGIAYPSYLSAVQKARRSDALAWFGQLQMAQARHRSHNPAYATLDQLGFSGASPGGHYRLSERAPTATGYEVLATAQGAQAGDAACRHLLLMVAGQETRHASGPGADLGNPEPVNRRCWGL